MMATLKNAPTKPNLPSLNLHSYIRVRPLLQNERKTSQFVFNEESVIVKGSADGSKGSKYLLFDGVFDEDTNQVSVYDAVVRPLIREVLQGYNCTVFAYGQTGTGKTYTMTGNQENPEESSEKDVHAGIIPRAVDGIFNQLMTQNKEYMVSVSYLELYNEKVKDLLSENYEASDIQLVDSIDGSGVTFRENVAFPVGSKSDAMKLLLQGSEKKQKASTLMNINSSRSHTIFSINVTVKDTLRESKEDLLKVGKLHLIDLAGSENATKSGLNEAGVSSMTKLAESSNINKSLLTLGRVIKSITEKKQHIPFRDSKLTRLLSDSLGGSTKTSLIATVSPAYKNDEETENTLKYATMARAIINIPEKNYIFRGVPSSKSLRVKKSVGTVQEEEFPRELYEAMRATIKELKSRLFDQDERYNALNDLFAETKASYANLCLDFEEKCTECENLKKKMNVEKQSFVDKESLICKEVVVRQLLLTDYEQTLAKLTDQNNQLLANENDNLNASAEFKEKLERELANMNNDLMECVKKAMATKEELADLLANTNNQFVDSSDELRRQVSSMDAKLQIFLKEKNKSFENLKNEIDSAMSILTSVGEVSIVHEKAILKSVSSNYVLTNLNYMDQCLTTLQGLLQDSLNQASARKQNVRYEKIKHDTDVGKAENVNEILNLLQSQAKDTLIKASQAQKLSNSALRSIMFTKKGAAELTNVNIGEAIEAIKHLHIMAKHSKQANDEVVLRVESIVQATNKLENLMKSGLSDNFPEEMSTLMQNTSYDDEETSKIVIKKVNGEIEKIRKAKYRLIEGFKKCYKSIKQELLTHHKTEDEAIGYLKFLVKKHMDDQLNKNECFYKYAELTLPQIKSKLHEEGNKLSHRFRELFMMCNTNSSYLQELEKDIKNKTDVLRGDISNLNYKSDQLSGLSPRGVATRQPMHPKSLNPIPKQDVMIQKLYDELSGTSTGQKTVPNYKEYMPSDLVEIMDQCLNPNKDSLLPTFKPKDKENVETMKVGESESKIQMKPALKKPKAGLLSKKNK